MRSILPVLICPVVQAIAQIHNKSARNDWNRLLFVYVTYSQTAMIIVIVRTEDCG